MGPGYPGIYSTDKLSNSLFVADGVTDNELLGVRTVLFTACEELVAPTSVFATLGVRVAKVVWFKLTTTIYIYILILIISYFFIS
jgi:hypothetical protein